MKLNKIEPRFKKNSNPRIGLIALATDFMIEKDFINVIKDKEIDFFVNRIECYNPLTKENLIKMSDKVTEVTNNILPNENLDCVVYGCTSGTIATGHDVIEKKVRAAKPKAELTTPSTAATKALKKLKVKKLAIFTPYSKKLNIKLIQAITSIFLKLFIIPVLRTTNPQTIKGKEPSTIKRNNFLSFRIFDKSL